MGALLVSCQAVLNSVDGPERLVVGGDQPVAARTEAVDHPPVRPTLAAEVTGKAEGAVDLICRDLLQYCRGDEGPVLLGMGGEECAKGRLGVWNHLQAQQPGALSSVAISGLLRDQLTTIRRQWTADRPGATTAAVSEVAKTNTAIRVNHCEDPAIGGGLVVDQRANPRVDFCAADAEQDSAEGTLMRCREPAAGDLGRQRIGTLSRVCLARQQNRCSDRISLLRIDAVQISILNFPVLEPIGIPVGAGPCLVGSAVPVELNFLAEERGPAEEKDHQE